MITTFARFLLGLLLLIASFGHFFSAEEFLAQVPPWMPAPEFVVLASGVVELVLGASLIFAPRHWIPTIGAITAMFFLAIFPGNLWQYFESRDAFGLDSDSARLTRLLFQPLLILWALWSTRAFATWRARRTKTG